MYVSRKHLFKLEIIFIFLPVCLGLFLKHQFHYTSNKNKTKQFWKWYDPALNGYLTFKSNVIELFETSKTTSIYLPQSTTYSLPKLTRPSEITSITSRFQTESTASYSLWTTNQLSVEQSKATSVYVPSTVY